MDLQHLLLSVISDENIIEAIGIPAESSIDKLLDDRDAEVFSQRWMAVFNLIESRKEQMSQSQYELSTKIRETAYLHAYARWRSPDLAAYVSDDFGLIADAAALGIDDPWINAMLRSYRQGVFPCSPELNYERGA